MHHLLRKKRVEGGGESLDGADVLHLYPLGEAELVWDNPKFPPRLVHPQDLHALGGGTAC